MREIFEWERILIGELPYEFLFEVIFRSAVMFIVLLITLKYTGKRGVRQLSVFETVIVIALGSAAGDPMFYEDVGILHAFIVFGVVLFLYRTVTWFTGKNKRFEEFIEGKTECIISEGKFSPTTFNKESLAQDEFFAELRLRSVEHLGQVRNAYLETTGEVSIFFFEDKDVGYGLPILPELFLTKSVFVPEQAIYSCATCGNTEELNSGQHICDTCGKKEWVKSINTLRVT
jgi:uncharacterized membrane protein YcaP (DUF421 family)/DNA-directed RNA polymerase subunit RPC12/RpoP